MDKALEGKVRLVIHTSPMEDKRKIHDVPYTHQSVLELLEGTGYGPAFIDNPDYAHIWLNDKPISPKDFETTYPAEGDILIAKLTPGVTVAAITAAISATFGAATAATAAAALATTVAGSITVGSLVAGAINIGLMAGVSMLASKIFAPKMSDMGGLGQPGSQAILVSGGKNKENLFGKVPKIYGEWRYTPSLAARSYTEVVGTDQFLREAFMIGMGDYDLSEFRIGTTPFSSYNDAELQVAKLSGEQGQGPGGVVQIHNTCMDLNGSNERAGNTQRKVLNLGSQVEGAIVGRWSVGMWIKPQGLTSNEHIFDATMGSKPKTSNAQYNFNDIKIRIMGATNGIRVSTHDAWSYNRNPAKRYQWDNCLVLNEWTHILVTYNQDEHEDTISLYINGVWKGFADSKPYNLFWGQMTDTKWDGTQRLIYIGSDRANDSGYYNEYFDGRIHSVGLWNTTLDADDAKGLYNNGAGDRFELTVNSTVESDLYDKAALLSHWWRFALDEDAWSIDYALTVSPIDLENADKNLSADDIRTDAPHQTDPLAEEDGALSTSLSLYPSSVTEDQVGILLKNKYGGPDPVVRATATGSTGFSITLLFSAGLHRTSDKGNERHFSVRIKMWYRRVGATEWILFKDDTINKKTKNPFYLHGSVTGLREDTYETKVEMISVEPKANYTTDRNGTGDNAIAIRGDAQYISLKSFSNGAPIDLEGLTAVAIRVRATEQLSGQIDNFNMLVKSKLPKWSSAGGFTEPTITRNPAWICLDILRGVANARPVLDSAIDLQTFADWADFCDEQGFTFDGVFDFTGTSVFQAFNTVAPAGRASLQVNGDSFSVVVDDPSFRSAPVQLFTARNSWGFRSTKVYPQTIHLVRAPFPNKEKGYVTDIAEVYNDGFDETNATNIIEAQEMRGLTDFESVHNAVRFDMLSQRFRPEIYQLTASLDALVARRGDKVRINHYLLADPDKTSARVNSITTDGSGNITHIEVDEKFKFELGVDYAIQVRHIPSSDFTDVGLVSPVLGPDVWTSTLELETPVATGSMATQDLVAFGEADLVSIDAVVTHIDNNSDLTASVTLIDESPEIQQALATGVIPDFNSQINTPKKNFLVPPPQPEILQTRRQIIGFGTDSDEPLVKINVDIVPGQPAESGFTQPTVGYKAQYRENDPEDTDLWEVQGVSTNLHVDLSVDSAGYRNLGPVGLDIGDSWTIGWWSKKTASEFERATVDTWRSRLWQLFEILDDSNGDNNAIKCSFQDSQINLQIFDSNGDRIVQHLYGEYNELPPLPEGTRRAGWGPTIADEDTLFVRDTWFLWNLSWDGTTMRFYRNGELLTPTFVSSNSGHAGMTDEPRAIAIGKGMPSRKRGSLQKLQQFAIWSTDLTAANMLKTYNGGRGCEFDLLTNANNYLAAEYLQHWFRFGPAGVSLEDARLVPVSEWGADEEGIAGTPFNVSDDAVGLVATDLTDDVPCGVAPNAQAIYTTRQSKDVEEGWITLPITDVNLGTIVIPSIRGTVPFDFRVWALGPGDVQSEVPTYITRNPIIGAAVVSAPTGLTQSTGTIIDSQGARATILFEWDAPELSDVENLVSYVVRWGRAGDSLTVDTVFITPGSAYAFEVDNPPGGIYSAALSAVDSFGQESEAIEIDFEWQPEIPIGPMKVQGLQQAQVEGSSGSTEVLGESFVITWRKSIISEQDLWNTGTRPCGNVPLLKDYWIEVFGFFDDDLETGNDPLLLGRPGAENLKKHGDFFTKDTSFTYDIATNTAQGFTDPDLPAGSNKQPDRKLMFVVRMRDTNGALSTAAIITLENTPPEPPQTVIAVDVGSRQLGVAWNVETDDPDFRGVIIWAVEGDQPDFEAIGSNIGVGNVVFKGSESPAKWDATPLNDDGSRKEYTVKIASYDAFPVVADKLNKVTV